LLVTTACIDLVAGRTSVTDEAPHLLCVAGWLLLHRLTALQPAGAPTPVPLAEGPPEPMLADSWSRAGEESARHDGGGRATGMSA